MTDNLLLPRNYLAYSGPGSPLSSMGALDASGPFVSRESRRVPILQMDTVKLLKSARLMQQSVSLLLLYKASFVLEDSKLIESSLITDVEPP